MFINRGQLDFRLLTHFFVKQDQVARRIGTGLNYAKLASRFFQKRKKRKKTKNDQAVLPFKIKKHHIIKDTVMKKKNLLTLFCQVNVPFSSSSCCLKKIKF